MRVPQGTGSLVIYGSIRLAATPQMCVCVWGGGLHFDGGGGGGLLSDI